MKILCKCGNLVYDTSVNQRYRWMHQLDWEQYIDNIDNEIEKIQGSDTKEIAIRNIRSSDKTKEIWICSSCGRVITIFNSEVIYMVIEKWTEPLTENNQN